MELQEFQKLQADINSAYKAGFMAIAIFGTITLAMFLVATGMMVIE